MTETKMDWEKNSKARLGGGTNMQAENAMMIPWMKRMAAKYHDRSKIERKKAMGKQKQERQQLLSMKGKRAMGNKQFNEGRCCNPIGGLKKDGKRANMAHAGGDHDGPERSG